MVKVRTQEQWHKNGHKNDQTREILSAPQLILKIVGQDEVKNH